MPPGLLRSLEVPRPEHRWGVKPHPTMLLSYVSNLVITLTR